MKAADGGLPMLEDLREIGRADASAEIPNPLESSVGVAIDEELSDLEPAVQSYALS